MGVKIMKTIIILFMLFCYGILFSELPQSVQEVVFYSVTKNNNQYWSNNGRYEFATNFFVFSHAEVKTYSSQTGEKLVYQILMEEKLSSINWNNKQIYEMIKGIRNFFLSKNFQPEKFSDVLLKENEISFSGKNVDEFMWDVDVKAIKTNNVWNVTLILFNEYHKIGKRSIMSIEKEYSKDGILYYEGVEF